MLQQNDGKKMSASTLDLQSYSSFRHFFLKYIPCPETPS